MSTPSFGAGGLSLIDPMGRLPIVKPNREKGAIHVSDKLVKTLETKVNDLIELSTELKLENQALKKRLADLQQKKRSFGAASASR